MHPILIYCGIMSLSASLWPSKPRVALAMFVGCSAAPWVMNSSRNVARPFVFLHYFCGAIWKFVEIANGQYVARSKLDAIIHTLSYTGLPSPTLKVRKWSVDYGLVCRTAILVLVASALNSIVLFLADRSSFVTAAAALFAMNLSMFTIASNCSSFIFRLLGYSMEPFFQAFWRAKSVGEFWRLWNVHLQRTLYRFVFKPLTTRGSGRQLASVAVFGISAAIHWVPQVIFADGTLWDVLAWNAFFFAQFAAIAAERVIFPHPPRGPSHLLRHLWVISWVFTTSVLVHVPLVSAFGYVRTSARPVGTDSEPNLS